MKKKFPNKKFFIPYGWKDLGKVKKTTSLENSKTITHTEIHTLCNKRVRIAKEDGCIFKYCPRCQMKLKNYIE